MTWTQFTLDPQLDAFTLCVFYSSVTVVACCFFFFFFYDNLTCDVVSLRCVQSPPLPTLSRIVPYGHMNATTRYDLGKYHYVRVFARQSHALMKLSASISAAATAATPWSHGAAYEKVGWKNVNFFFNIQKRILFEINISRAITKTHTHTHTLEDAHTTETSDKCLCHFIFFLLIVFFFDKGTKWVCEQDYADNCQKTQTVVFPIQLNRDPQTSTTET